MRYLIFFFFLSLFFLNCGNDQSSSPNIILLIADQWSVADSEDLSALKQLKANGTNFTNAFTSSPDPELAEKSLLSGFHTGHLLSKQYDKTSEKKLSQFLTRRGYQFHQLDNADEYLKLNNTAPIFCIIRLKNKPPADVINKSLNLLLKVQEENPNTLVITTAFNGGENNYSEVNLRVPFVASYPKKSAGKQTSKQYLYTADVATAISGILGIQWPFPTDGQSFHQALFNKNTLPTDRILYWESPNSPATQILRYNQWKMIKSSKEQDWKIYDLITDPEEKDNVAAYHPGKRQKFIEWIDKNR